MLEILTFPRQSGNAVRQRLRYDLDHIIIITIIITTIIIAITTSVIISIIITTVIVLSRVCGHVEDWEL